MAYLSKLFALEGGGGTTNSTIQISLPLAGHILNIRGGPVI